VVAFLTNEKNLFVFLVGFCFFQFANQHCIYIESKRNTTDPLFALNLFSNSFFSLTCI
jgi:hypothetical protein